MSPGGQARKKNVIIPNNLYTVILALAFCVVLTTTAFVAVKCYLQYGTILKIP